MFDAVLSELEMDLRTALVTCVTELVATARARLEDAQADVAKERAQLLVEVAEERAKALAEVDARRAELGREVAVMQKHKEVQEGRVELNIGGYCFETSVQTLRRVPHTFFDAYFSGRYAQDVCTDGSIFVDRDGEHFGHILEYMRDGFVSVAEADTYPSVSLLRA
jgi:septum formation topological specificity factor MinE